MMPVNSSSRRSARAASTASLGAVHVGWLLLAGSALVLAVLIALLVVKPQSAPTNQPLLVYCAAGLRLPVQEIARDYEKQYGVPVQLNYGGSEVLLASIEVARTGDLYLPADESYARKARDKGLAQEVIPLAVMTPVVAVRKGNPAGISQIEDLLAEQIKLGQANPEAAAIGKLVKTALTQSGHWDRIAARTRVFKGTVNEIANDVKLGVLDATFVWDALMAQYPDLERISLPELDPHKARVQVAVLSATKQPAAALRFARFLSARDRGLPVFERHGYPTVEGDVWAERPDLRVLSGAMLRPAVEQTINDFEKREGVRVTRGYNGCGILVAQMRAGERPDAYFSCDVSFMTQVNDLFLDVEDMSRNPMVILVPKGNPKNLLTLEDLGRETLKIGVGHEKQSALGALTMNMLVKSGHYDAIRKNVTVESATGDFLVNQLRTGSLDAVIVYRSNANTALDRLDAIPLAMPEAVAIQPVAVGRESDHRQLARRLLDAVRSDLSHKRFLDAGFDWAQAQE